MEGPTFTCEYLNYKTLPKPATSIAGLQGPVKELYLQFRKAQQHGTPPRQSSFKVTPAGLLVALQESGGPLEMFFDISTINLMEAVRFAVIKGSEKKPKAIFVPLDERGGPVSDKSAFTLDKAFHYLAQANHQPLLVCVLRRPKGVKALDCHVFAMDSVDSALAVQAMVRQLIASGPPAAGGDSGYNRASTRGDFIRTEFGDYNVYRGGPGQQQQSFELKDEHFRGGGGGGGGVGGGGGGGGFPPQLDPGPGPRGGGQPSPRETYPAESGERPRFGWSYDKPQGGEEFRRGAGQYGGVEPSPRPASGELRTAPNQFYGDSRGPNQFPADRRSGELMDERGGGVGGGGGGGVFRTGSGYGGERRGEVGEQPKPGHARERSGDSGDQRVAGLSRKVSGGSDGGRAGYGDPRYGPVSPRGEAPPKVMEKPVSPVRLGPAPGPAPGSRSESPRLPPSPYSPTSPTPGGGPFGEGPAFSLSNRESRGDGVEEPVQPGKPVAKVPPHLKGVKVLPSDFLAVKLKPKQQRSESEEGEAAYDNHKQVMAQYKQLQEQEAQQGFTNFQDRDLDKPAMPRSYTDNWNDDPPGSGSGYDPQYRRFPPAEDERRYIEQYSDQDTVQLRHYGQQQRYDDQGPGGKSRFSAPDYGGAGDPQPVDQYRSQSAYNMGAGQGYPRAGAPAQGRGGVNAPSSAANDDRQMGRKKDAEIASMFSNVRIQGREDAYERNNFEESLGYLP